MKTYVAAVLLLVAATGSMPQRQSAATPTDKAEQVKTLNGSAKTSLVYSCLDAPFLSVSVKKTGRHDGFVDVELRLTDSLDRSAGYGSNERPIPKSSYGKVVELPNRPEMSKAVAVEVCDATQGQYELTVWEHGQTEYLIDVTGMDNRHHYADILYPKAEEGRACLYRFVFGLGRSRETIQWLDESGRALSPQERPTCLPLQQAYERQGTRRTPATLDIS